MARFRGRTAHQIEAGRRNPACGCEWPGITAGPVASMERVWSDFDHLVSLVTEVSPRDVPRWTMISEKMKAHLGFQLGLGFGCYAFTVNVLPALELKWANAKAVIPAAIQRRIKRELDAVSLSDLPYFYLIEGSTKSGNARAKIHIHGYFIAEESADATKMKCVFERALRQNELRKIERRNGIKLELAYDCGGERTGRWVSYISKNAYKRDRRISGRRVFMSTSLTQITSDFWSLLRQEPLKP